MVRPDVARARIGRATARLQGAEGIFSRDAEDRGVIDRAVADRLREGVGLRNRIAHGYALLDYQRVRSEALIGMPAMRASGRGRARDSPGRSISCALPRRHASRERPYFDGGRQAVASIVTEVTFRRLTGVART